MFLTECPECNTVTPNFRTCTNCQTIVNEDLIPSSFLGSDEITKVVSDLAAQATYETVSFERLRSDHDQYDRPICGYLQNEEQPHALYRCSKIEFINQGEDWTESAGLTSDGHLLITSKRLLCLLPNENRTQVVAIEYQDMIDARSKSPLVTRNRLIIDCVDDSTYKLYGLDADSLDPVVNIIEGRYENVGTEKSRAIRLDNAIDDIVASADEAAEAFEELSELFDNQDTVTRYDDIFAEAETLDYIAESLRVEHQNQQDSELLTGQQAVDSASTTQHPEQNSIPGQVKGIARDAEPKEVGKWAIGAGIAGGTYAVTAPFSTAVGLAAILAGGASAGAIASANPESKLAGIDPLKTAVHMRTAGITHKRNSAPGGYGTGAAINAIEHVDTEDIPPAYAKWLSQVDVDTVMRDAELAVKTADRSPQDHDKKLVQALGGSVGVAHSYINAGDGPDLKEIVDKDLYEEAVSAIENESSTDDIHSI